MGRKRIGEVVTLGPFTPHQRRAIFEEMGAYANHPFRILGQEFVAMTEEAARRLPAYKERSLTVLLTLLEGFLAITGFRLKLRPFDWVQNRPVLELFVGAVQSEKFLAVTNDRRYVLTSSFLALLKQFPWAVPEDWFALAAASTVYRSIALKEWASRSEELELLPLELEFWMGWPCTNKYGDRTWLDLAAVFERFGPDYARRLHVACAEAFAAGRGDYVPAERLLFRFMTRNFALTLAAQWDEDASAEFFKELCTFCIINKTQLGRVESVVTLWRNSFKAFAENHLIPSGLFVEPSGVFPCPPVRRVLGPKTHLRDVDGVEVRTKWVTAFPVELDDADALRVKCDEVKKEVELIAAWATAKCGTQWDGYKRRVALWQTGQPRLFSKSGEHTWKWLISRENPAYFANAAATLRHYGYLPRREKKIDVKRAYPSDLNSIAEELGLPVVGALLPHMTLLVIEHHEITASFLETLELYDRHGNRVGFARDLTGYHLKGYKRRRGKTLAELTIKLNSNTTRIILRVLALTSVVRRYLRAKGDDSWRYLFLSTGRAFGYPTRIRSLAGSVTSQPYQVEKFGVELARTTDCDESYALSVASRFSLPALRGQMVVLLYLETHSTRLVAMALGHHRFSFQLVERYIPEAIMHFFFDRWIRVYQTSCIIEALRNSELLLEASCLRDEETLKLFIANHTLDMHSFLDKSTPEELASSETVSGATVLIGVDEPFMTLLCSLSLARQQSPERIRPSIRFWSELADPLIAQIESVRDMRPDLAEYLDAGKSNASVDLVATVIYD